MIERRGEALNVQYPMLLRRWTFASRVDGTYVRRRWRPRPTRALSPAQEIQYACGLDAVMRAIESRQHSQLKAALRCVSESKCDPCVAPAPEPPELAPGKPPIGVRYDRACLVSHDSQSILRTLHAIGRRYWRIAGRSRD